jgi:hypothetical protein
VACFSVFILRVEVVTFPCDGGRDGGRREGQCLKKIWQSDDCIIVKVDGFYLYEVDYNWAREVFQHSHHSCNRFHVITQAIQTWSWCDTRMEGGVLHLPPTHR